MKRYLILVISTLPFIIPLFLGSKTSAMQCSPGYEYSPRSGVDCKQVDCNDIPDAHWSYEGYCICGSSGSLYEDSNDPNQECNLPKDSKPCPGCLLSCIGVDETCPDTEQIEKNKQRCVDHCQKYLRNGGDQSEVLQVSGTYPKCNCSVDLKNNLGQLQQSIQLVAGDKETTHTFNVDTGLLTKKETISIAEEKEKIREELGFKFSEEVIDEKIDEDKISKWFQDEVKDIKTSTSILTASFWTQHIMAILDHGFGNSADFVDTYQYGRCGDSMLWLEKRLASEIDIGEKKQEAFLSITGENYGNLTNHTAIMIRPKGVDNLEWAEAVNNLVKSSGNSSGLNQDEIKNIDERILKAKVIDPYFKTETTVEDFIKGWSVIRVS